MKEGNVYRIETQNYAASINAETGLLIDFKIDGKPRITEMRMNSARMTKVEATLDDATTLRFTIALDLSRNDDGVTLDPGLLIGYVASPDQLRIEYSPLPGPGRHMDRGPALTFANTAQA
ncbi:MAG: hypothetical protein FWG05_03905, partial [Kiritimatiellaeota bacterium]|nr:hypothetical protein [Kiritimatiellota bacterium]